MIFKCGIVGLPNVGKSTLFNVLTYSSVKCENFPFCTIEVNKGFISVLDIRLHKLAIIIQTNNIIYGNIELIDTAGLIKGASHGEGLGNKFLNDISKVDVLLHVVKCFNKIDIYHVNDTINPKEDITTIHNELILSDLNVCEKIIDFHNKSKKLKNTNIEKTLHTLKKIYIYLSDGNMLYDFECNVEEKIIIQNYNFLTFKPIIYVANIDKNNDKNHYLLELSTLAIKNNIPYIPMCILLEEKIMKSKYHNIIFDENSFEQYLKNSNFFYIINSIYQVLQLKTFFTINTSSVKSWIVRKDTVAIQAANMVHSDFKKYFIRVQVVKYYDFIICQGWKKLKKCGKIKIEGRNYIIQDGDILNFLI